MTEAQRAERKENRRYSALQYRRNHRGVLLEKMKEYRESHRDQLIAYGREYYVEHRAQILERKRGYNG